MPEPVLDRSGGSPIVRRAAILAILFGLALGVPARAVDPPRLAGPVTDLVGALADGREPVEGAIDQLLAQHGVQLFVLFVDTTDDLTVTGFAEETARLNSLGVNDALLVVALDDRTDAIWVSDALPITDDELDDIIAGTLEPGLAGGDFAAAVIATAEALGLAADVATPGPPATEGPIVAPPPDTGPGNGRPGPGIDLGTLAGLTLLGLGIVVTGLWLLGRIVAWRETGERTRRTAALAREANSQLIATDDRVRAAEQEIGFVEAQYGEAEAEPFRAAVAEAKQQLRGAYAIRQRLDDHEPEDPPTRQTMLAELMGATERANAALDAQVQRIEQLRSLERDAPSILAALPAQLDAVEDRLPEGEAALGALGAYAPSAWASVAGNATEARKGVAGARAAIQRGRATVETDRAKAAREIVLAQKGIAGAAALLDAIGKLATTLRESEAALPAELEAAVRDLTDAMSAIEAAPEIDAPSYEAQLARTRRELGAAPRRSISRARRRDRSRRTTGRFRPTSPPGLTRQPRRPRRAGR